MICKSNQMRNLTLFFFLLLTGPSFAQTFDPGILDNLTGQRMSRAEHYAGQDIWNYLKGNADLYYEYGCNDLYVRDYTSDNETVRVEVTVMRDAAASFGIFELLEHPCLIPDKLTEFSCHSYDQTTAAYGPLYICIKHPTGSKNGTDVAGQVITAVTTGYPLDQMTVPVVFRQPRVYKYIDNLHFYEGMLGLQAGLPQWLQMFENVNFRMFAAVVPDPDTSAIIARIVFPSNSDLRLFLSNAGNSISDKTTAPYMGNSGLYHSWYQIDDYKILFLETTQPVSLFQYLPQLRDVNRNIWDWKYD